MTRFPHLDRAPIVEGLVDLRVRLPDGFKVENLKDFDAGVAERYPRAEAQMIHEGRFSFGPGEGFVPEESETPRVRGYRRLSEDGLNIVQFRSDGFTFSRLAPYDTWDRMYSEAMSLWAAYVDVSQPLGVTRLATRFINRIHLPMDANIEDYLKSGPNVPESLPQMVASFMVKYVSIVPEENLMANVTVATEQRTDPSSQPILLDIDCFFPGLDLSVGDAAEIHVKFERLHEHKNQIFFETMTPNALDLFR